MSGAGKKVRTLSQMELDAIRWKESSGLPDDEITDGDNGKAIGPMQVWEIYWKDANQYNKKLGGTYEDCRRRQYAEDTVRSYVARYADSGASLYDVARLHNAGPKARKNKTISATYAAIVVRNYEALKAGKTPKNE